MSRPPAASWPLRADRASSGVPPLDVDPIESSARSQPPADPAHWSGRLAAVLLRLTALGRVDAVLAPLIGRGRLDQADALAGLIRYCVMGGLATAVYFFCAIGLHPAGLGPNTTSAIAIGVSVVASFLMQSRVTFRTGRLFLADAARFGIIGLIGLTMSRLLVDSIHLRAGLPFWTAALAVCLLVPVANFTAMNFWVFAGRGERAR